MKSRRRQFTIGATIALLLAVAGLLALHRKEPSYQDKTVAQCFTEFCAAEPKYTKRIPAARGQGGFYIDSNAWLRDPAARALRALGSNAVPYLAKEMCRPRVSTYQKVLSALPTSLRKLLPPSRPSNPNARGHAALALQFLLGAEADAAAPILVAHLKDADADNLASITSVLRSHSYNPSDVDAALELLERRGQTTNAYVIVEGLSLRTRTAARMVAQGLSSADPSHRRKAASMLQFFGPAAVVAVPALTAALTNQDGELRYLAACALEEAGTNARPAVAALRQATNDPSPMVRRAAARALSKLEPDPPI
jgi:hypothetical protein